MGRISFITTVALAAALLAPATGVAKVDLPQPPPSSIAAGEARTYQDLRSPDAKDAGRVTSTQVTQDLRSPDAKDASAAAQATAYQDLRSPDARDVGREPAPVQAPEPLVQIREAPGSGFHWGDAGIGAAGILALLSIAGGLTLMSGGRRRRRGVEATAH